MIKIVNQNDENAYKSLDKIYIPNDYINANYSYRMNGEYITIITNNNCRTQYNSTYCDCRQYNWKLNLISGVYECNTNNSNPIIPFTSITNDINYSQPIKKEFNDNSVIYLGMIILAILFATLIVRRNHY